MRPGRISAGSEPVSHDVTAAAYSSVLAARVRHVTGTRAREVQI